MRAPSAAAAALLPLERTHRGALTGTNYNNDSTWPREPHVYRRLQWSRRSRRNAQLEDTIQTLNVKVAKLANAWHAINAQQRQMTDELVALKQKNLTREAMEFINNLEGTIDGIDDCFLLEQNVLGWEEDL